MGAQTLPRFKTQKEAKLVIQKSIDTNERAVYKALRQIYSRQTTSEQALFQTVEDNKMGFGAFDAELLTGFAQQVLQRRYLTAKQLLLARKKIRCYWKQLAQMANRWPV